MKNSPTPTPHNAQPPQWRKITKEDPPQCPCWIYSILFSGFLWHCSSSDSFTNCRGDDDTHWHPDGPTPPDSWPDELSQSSQADDGLNARKSPEPATAAQLKSMTDQFLAVSGQLGEAKEALKREAESWDSEAVSAETCIERRLYENAQEKLEFRSEASRARKRAAAIRAHLAQSDSPGAGKEGEGL